MLFFYYALSNMSQLFHGRSIIFYIFLKFVFLMSLFLSYPGLVLMRVTSSTLRSVIVWTSSVQGQSPQVPDPPPNTSTINYTWCRHGTRRTGVKWLVLPTCSSPAINPTATCVSPSSFRSTRPTCGATNLKRIRTISSSVSVHMHLITTHWRT